MDKIKVWFGTVVEWLKKAPVLLDLLMSCMVKGKAVLAATPAAIKDYLKKTWILWAVIICAVFLYGGDISQFAFILLLLAPVAAVLLVAERVFDPREGWGLFPGLDLQKVITMAMSTPLSCALIFLGMSGLLVSLLICAAMVIRP